MEDREVPPLSVRVIGSLLFILGAFSALFWFSYRTIHLFNHAYSEIVVLDKGSFYMLGVGIGMSVLSFALVQEGILGKVLSNKQANILTRISMVSIALIFIVPNLFHFIADAYFSDRGYAICEEASHEWLISRNIMYIKDSIECSDKLKEK